MAGIDTRFHAMVHVLFHSYGADLRFRGRQTSGVVEMGIQPGRQVAESGGSCQIYMVINPAKMEIC